MKQFRYLEKYVGKYRVLAEVDLSTNDFPRDENNKVCNSYEDLYIPCKIGVIRHTYENNILAWWSIDGEENIGTDVYNRLKTANKGIWLRLEDLGTDAIIRFKEDDIDKIAKVVKPKTAGSDIPPFSFKNVPNSTVTVPKEELASLKDMLKAVPTAERSVFIRKCNKEFNENIRKKKGKRFDPVKAKNDSGLNDKEFIYSIGMWKDYCKFIDKKVKSL